jgi:hypothetical protein
MYEFDDGTIKVDSFCCLALEIYLAYFFHYHNVHNEKVLHSKLRMRLRTFL